MNILEITWNLYENSFEKVYELHGAARDFSTVFGPDVKKLLILLKLLPQKQRGRQTAASRSNFVQSTDKLITFVEVRIKFVIFFNVLYSAECILSGWSASKRRGQYIKQKEATVYYRSGIYRHTNIALFHQN